MAVGLSTWPVGSFPAGASWCRAQDLAGNAWEWCADWYGDYSATPVINPTGPVSGDQRMIRGGSWGYGRGDTRGAHRNLEDPSSLDNGEEHGFRCVSLAPGP
jgi:formylglycine-generating enzyme required for sulfatase activity